MKSLIKPGRRRMPGQRTPTSPPMRGLVNRPQVAPARPADTDEAPVAGPSSRPGGPLPGEAERSPTGSSSSSAVDAPTDLWFIPVDRPKVEFSHLDTDNDVYGAKATRLAGLLESHPTIGPHLAGRLCTIDLRRHLLPAEISDRPGTAVTVKLAASFFEGYPMGYVAGMLCHEFGVHSVAEQWKFPEEPKSVLLRDAPLYRRDRLVPGGKHVNTKRAYQKDHVAAAITESERHKLYRKIVLEMANLLLREADGTNLPQPDRPDDVKDLLDCYLMDLASIAVTNDELLRGGPLPTQRTRKDVRDAYAGYRGELMRYETERNTADGSLPAVPMDHLPAVPTDEQIDDQYRYLWRTLLKGLFSAPSMS